MTNESISGFLNSIAEAKRAFDAEPEHLQRIQDLEADQRRLGETVAARELRIHSLKQDNDALLGKLRSVEAERDDAGFRHLEADDKVQSLLKLVHGVINDALKAVSAVEGKESIIINKVDYNDDMTTIRKQEEEIVGLQQDLDRLQNEMRRAQEQLTRPFASATQSSQGEGTDPSFKPSFNYADNGTVSAGEVYSDKREPYPTASIAPSSPPPSPNVSSDNAANVDGAHTTTGEDPFHASGSDPIPPASGQSEKDPTDSPIGSSKDTLGVGQSEGPFAATAHTEPQSASSPIAETSKDAASPPERNRDRSTFFKGRKYFDITYVVPLHQWLNEGGSREDYYWRPAEANVPLPEASQASHRS